MSDESVFRPAMYVSFVRCLDPAGAHYIVRWEVQADDLAAAQEKTIRQLGDARSIPTGPGGSIVEIETVEKPDLTLTRVRRRDVPLFELDLAGS